MIDYTDLIGVPFKNRGRDVKTGVDCYGLVIEVFKRFGHNIPEYYADYDDTEAVNDLIVGKTSIKSNWQPVSIEELTVPTLLAFPEYSQSGS